MRGRERRKSVGMTSEETTFSLPIEIITEDLDELCLSPVESGSESRSGSPLASTPVGFFELIH
jgi:hypothetical protein